MFRINKFSIFLYISVFCVTIVLGQKKQTSILNSNNWILEAENKDSTFIKWTTNAVEIDAKAGATLWYKQKLSGHYTIEYDRKIYLDKVFFPRVSDINQFWAANYNNKFPFNQSGAFKDYDSFQMYYFGFGGNSNKTTRFRYYDGQGNRNLLKEYLNYENLIHSDTVYHIKTEVNINRTKVWINNQLYFDYQSTENIPSGYFGLRLTWSAQTISNLRITKF